MEKEEEEGDEEDKEEQEEEKEKKEDEEEKGKENTQKKRSGHIHKNVASEISRAEAFLRPFQGIQKVKTTV